MTRAIAAVASFLSFLAYLFDNNRVKSSGFAWLRFLGSGARDSGLGFRRGEAQFGSGVFSASPEPRGPEARLFQFPVSIFEFPNSAIGKEEKRTTFFRQPLSISNITKGPTLNISFALKWLIL